MELALCGGLLTAYLLFLYGPEALKDILEWMLIWGLVFMVVTIVTLHTILCLIVA